MQRGELRRDGMQNTQVRIRQATTEDVGAILHCLRAAFEPYRQLYSAEAFADTTLTVETLLRRLAEMTVLVACSDSHIVGTVAFHRLDAATGHFRGMAVLPQWQSIGVAQRLLAELEHRLKALACSRVTLDTTGPLERAIHFYERNGYRRSGKIADFFGMPLYEYEKLLH